MRHHPLETAPLNRHEYPQPCVWLIQLLLVSPAQALSSKGSLSVSWPDPDTGIRAWKLCLALVFAAGLFPSLLGENMEVKEHDWAVGREERGYRQLGSCWWGRDTVRSNPPIALHRALSCHPHGGTSQLFLWIFPLALTSSHICMLTVWKWWGSPLGSYLTPSLTLVSLL